MVGDVFLEDGGGEGSKSLSLFHLGIEPVPHGGIPGVGQDTAGPEGARAKLHGPVEPANDFLGRQPVHHRRQQGIFPPGEVQGRDADGGHQRGNVCRRV